MTTPEAALATRHVKGQTWDSGSPEAVDGFITWCKGCGQRPWPCDTRKALDLLEAALTPLAPEVPPHRELDEAIGRLVGVAGTIARVNRDGDLDPKHPYFWPDLDEALARVNAARLAATRPPEPSDSGDGAAPIDAVYGERNRLVAALAHLFGNAAWRGLDPTAPDFTVVYIDLPTGQVSWHIPDAEMDGFPPLPMRDPTGWDGHDSDEKYRRLTALRRGDICRDVNDAVIAAVNHERGLRSGSPVPEGGE